MTTTQTDQKLMPLVRKMVTIVVERTKAEKPYTNFSATVIWFRGKQWIVTAAHCAKALIDDYNSGRLIRWGAGDAWANEDGRGQLFGLPKDYANRWIVLSEDKEDSYDVAMLDIGPNIAANLEAGKIIIIPEAEWMNPPEHFAFYRLIGTPNETYWHNGRIETDANGVEHYWLPTTYDLQRGVLNLEKTVRPSTWKEYPHPRFYGKINTDHVDEDQPIRTLESILGASGGPIFGCVKKQGGFTYHLLAIQSAWEKPLKTVEADYLTLMPKRFDRAQAKLAAM